MQHWLELVISHPVEALQKRIETVGSGNFAPDRTVEWNNELGDIGRGINQLAENVDSLMTRRVEDERRKQGSADLDGRRTAGPFALCKIGLVTGRTHQIRAHLAYLGKPVLGDIKYGNRKMNERTGTKTQALCAVRISFLDVPEENTLHYLSGKGIKLKDPQILQQFDALDKSKNV